MTGKASAAAQLIAAVLAPRVREPAARRGTHMLGSAGRLAGRLRPRTEDIDDVEDEDTADEGHTWDSPEWGPAELATVVPKREPRPQTSAEQVARLLRQPREPRRPRSRPKDA